MTPRLTSQPSLGASKAGVCYATAPRHDLRIHVGAYQRTGWENAPLVPMDEPAHYRVRAWEVVVAAIVVLGIVVGCVS